MDEPQPRAGHGQPKLITFPLRKGHQTEQIRERWLCDDFDREAEALMKMLERCYAKAPQRDTVLPLVRSILAHPERNLALFTENALRRICAYMDIRTPIYRGSSLGLPAKMDMQDRVIQIVHRMDGELYLNPIGGIELYCPLASGPTGCCFASCAWMTSPIRSSSTRSCPRCRSSTC